MHLVSEFVGGVNGQFCHDIAQLVTVCTHLHLAFVATLNVDRCVAGTRRRRLEQTSPCVQTLSVSVRLACHVVILLVERHSVRLDCHVACPSAKRLQSVRLSG